MNVKGWVLEGAVALAVLGCGPSSSFHSTAQPPRAVVARAPESVAVLTALPPGSNAIEIGQMDAASSTHAPTGDGKAEALAQLQQLAGKNGCDIIVVSEPVEDLYATSNGTPLYKTHQHATCFMNR